MHDARVWIFLFIKNETRIQFRAIADCPSIHYINVNIVPFIGL